MNTRTPILSVVPLALLLVFGLSYSGSGNARTDEFEISGTVARVHWEATARDDSTCYFSVALIGLDDAGELRSWDRIAKQAFFGHQWGSGSGDITIDVEPGTFVVNIFAEHYRYADGSTEGCRDYRVTVDG